MSDFINMNWTKISAESIRNYAWHAKERLKNQEIKTINAEVQVQFDYIKCWITTISF